MVTPRSCSSARVSVKRASPAAFAEIIPALQIKESVKVDLPWSTCAMTLMERMLSVLSMICRIWSTVKFGMVGWKLLQNCSELRGFNLWLEQLQSQQWTKHRQTCSKKCMSWMLEWSPQLKQTWKRKQITSHCSNSSCKTSCLVFVLAGLNLFITFCSSTGSTQVPIQNFHPLWNRRIAPLCFVGSPCPHDMTPSKVCEIFSHWHL